MQLNDDLIDPNDNIEDEKEDEMEGFHLADDDEEKPDKDGGDKDDNFENE